MGLYSGYIRAPRAYIGLYGPWARPGRAYLGPWGGPFEPYSEPILRPIWGQIPYIATEACPEGLPAQALF